MEILEMTELDFQEFWPIFIDIVKSRDSYAIDPDISYDEGMKLWLHSPAASYVAKDKEILGSYYIKKNASGPGSHIANCGYMVAPGARGKGIATKMCIHSQDQAKKMGFLAIQFNSVVSTNKAAVNLWKKLGFKIIGTIPEAFQHGQSGLVDSYIMHKFL